MYAPLRAPRADTPFPPTQTLAARASAMFFGILLLSFSLAQPLGAQARQAAASARKLPSPEKIVGEYLKTVGGKKRQVAIRDAVYEWAIADSAQGETHARVLTKAPVSVRSEFYADGIERVGAANARTAWRTDANSGVRTLTGIEAHTLKLQAALGASRFVDFKKMKVLARTVGVEQAGGEQAYIVEFSTKEGGRARYWFGTTSRLLLKSDDGGSSGVYVYGDYRSVNGTLEPHRTTHEKAGKPDATFILQHARYNTSLADALFEPPADAALDIPALLRDLASNQSEVDRRINDYTYTRKVTEREVSDRGEIKKEKLTVYEVYPIAGWGRVQKLVSENGVALTPERAAKEERRVAEELAKAEQEAPKREEERRRKRAERAAKVRQREGGEAVTDEDGDDDVGIATFLRACELVSPRRERFDARETIVFDFRPRASFRPRTRGESIVSKLAGTIWVDPTDRQVMRLEAKFIEGFKVGGGLAAIKSGSAFVFEQTRLEDGVWLPRFSQVNVAVRLLFLGKSINETHEFSDYKRFSTKTGEDKLDAPEEKP